MKWFIEKVLKLLPVSLFNKKPQCKPQKPKCKPEIESIRVVLPASKLAMQCALEEYEALVFKKTRKKPFA